jgi:hypothetical protein
MKGILLAILCCALGSPLAALPGQKAMVPKSGHPKLHKIDGKLVIDVAIPWRVVTNPTQPFLWRLVVITPEQKRINFLYNDVGAPHSVVIRHVKKGPYTIKIINDQPNVSLVGVTSPSYFLRMQYQKENGLFYNVSNINLNGAVLDFSWLAGSSVEYRYTVTDPARITRNFQP